MLLFTVDGLLFTVGEGEGVVLLFTVDGLQFTVDLLASPSDPSV